MKVIRLLFIHFSLAYSPKEQFYSQDLREEHCNATDMMGWSRSQNVEVVTVSRIVMKENIRCNIEICGTDLGSEPRHGPHWFSGGLLL
jgi:hypothetical protein